MNRVLPIILFFLSMESFSKTYSFECKGIYTSKDGVESKLSNSVLINTDSYSGTRTNSKGRVTNFTSVQITNEYFRAFEKNWWDESPVEVVYINRKTFESKVNGGVGLCLLKNIYR